MHVLVYQDPACIHTRAYSQYQADRRALNDYLFIHIFLNGIVVASVNLVQVDGVIDIHPHVVLCPNMLLETLSYTLHNISVKPHKVIISCFSGIFSKN